MENRVARTAGGRRRRRPTLAPGGGEAKNIVTYLVCRLCVEDKPDDTSMEEYARLNVGSTLCGIQVWCVRHDVNVIHVDFEGQQHPAWIGRITKGSEEIES
jgi:hypothetical protein